MVKGEVAIDVYMKDKFVFPYDYLNEAQNELEIKNKYNIYYVLKGHKYIIKKIQIIDAYNFIVCIQDLANKKEVLLPLNIFFLFSLPDLECVDMKLSDNNLILLIDFTDKGMTYLKSFKPDFIETNNEIIQKYGKMRIHIHAKFLMDMFYEFQNKEHVDEYELLYVGQTKKDNIFDRLYGHNTIPEIVRYFNRDDESKKYQIEIMVTGVHIKLYDQIDINYLNAHIIASNNLPEDFLINEGMITKGEVIDIAEAMLILFFKPPYNDKLKNTKSPENLNIYSKFNECLINPITYSLDLYFEDSKKKIILGTKQLKTSFKQNVIKCEFSDEGKVENLSLEHFPTDVYL